LKDSNVDPNIQEHFDEAALHWASREGHLQVVQALLSHPKIEPNLKDRRGNTALIWASGRGHLDVVQEILKHPLTNPNVKGEYDITAIVWASNGGGGHSQVVQALLEHPKIDSNVKKESQDYELTSELRNEMDAIIASHEERYGGEIKIDEVDVSIFKDLIEKGAYVNTLDEYFFTPLHWASYKGDIEFVKFLIERGAVLDISSVGCTTPLELSKSNEIIDLLS
jgi:ankyrin repeat protein